MRSLQSPLLITFAFTLIFNSCSCTKKVDCYDRNIQLAFIGFQLSDIDTLIIRKFKTGNNYQNLVDSFAVTYNDYYRTSNDTTKIAAFQRDDIIIAGFDWQIFIPALNKTVFISGIVSNKKTIECGALAVPVNCSCTNDLFSAKKDNQVVNFTNTDIAPPYIYIAK